MSYLYSLRRRRDRDYRFMFRLKMEPLEYVNYSAIKKWLKENTKGSYRCRKSRDLRDFSHHVYMDEERDAALFKLFWSEAVEPKYITDRGSSQYR